MSSEDITVVIPLQLPVSLCAYTPCCHGSPGSGCCSRLSGGGLEHVAFVKVVFAQRQVESHIQTEKRVAVGVEFLVCLLLFLDIQSFVPASGTCHSSPFTVALSLVLSRFWARTLPKWGKHVAQHGQACCPTWAHFLFMSCPKSSIFHDRVLHILLSEIRTRVTCISPSGETERGLKSAGKIINKWLVSSAQNSARNGECPQHPQIPVNPKINPITHSPPEKSVKKSNPCLIFVHRRRQMDTKCSHI